MLMTNVSVIAMLTHDKRRGIDLVVGRQLADHDLVFGLQLVGDTSGQVLRDQFGDMRGLR